MPLPILPQELIDKILRHMILMLPSDPLEALKFRLVCTYFNTTIVSEILSTFGTKSPYSQILKTRPFLEALLAEQIDTPIASPDSEIITSIRLSVQRMVELGGEKDPSFYTDRLIEAVIGNVQGSTIYDDITRLPGEYIDFITDSFPDDVHSNGTLVLAASCNDINMLQNLLKDQDVEVVDQLSVYFGRALTAAARNGHLETVEFLLKRGAKVVAEWGGPSRIWMEDPIQAACVNNHENIVYALLNPRCLFESYVIEPYCPDGLLGSHGSDDSEGSDGLYDKEVAELSEIRLLEAIRITLTNRNLKLASVLVNYGKRHYAHHDLHVFHQACKSRCLELAESMLAELNIQDFEVGDVALLEVCTSGHPEAVNFLLAHGAGKGPKGALEKCLFEAAMGGSTRHIQIARLLIDAGAPFGEKGRTSLEETPLLLALNNNKIEMARYLLERGATLDLKFDGPRVLKNACELGMVSVARVVLGLGVDPDGKNFGVEFEGVQIPPMLFASGEYCHKVVEVLRQFGAAEVDLGSTPAYDKYLRTHKPRWALSEDRIEY